jgi:twitching motility two-component system response regulator PilH
VPDSVPTPAPPAPRRNIVLIEAYDAISAAIGAALKKFAPEHTISVASSLSEAEALARKSDPELFVIDADPPWSGVTDFLEKMRTAHPNARALVIGVPIPADIAAERRFSGALQFIEKPFELPTFGAAVQALLGPWRESDPTSARGNFGALNAIDVLLLHYAANATVIVDLRAGKTGFGEIQICNGQVSHAEAGKLTGLDALGEILTSPELRMRERIGAVVARRTVERGWSNAVLETLRALKTAKAGRQLVEEEPSIQPTRQPTGKNIVAIDDTEMLLVFVEDVLRTADLGVQVTTAQSGSEGIQRVQNITPDLVLLDYNLPDFNGDEVCRRLLQDARTARIPVVLMSAHASEMKAAAPHLENVVATIEKPFFAKQLIDLVQRTLAEPHPRRAAKARPIESAAPVAATPPKVEPLPPPATLEVTPLDGNEAVLGLFLEVTSMQFTPQLQMGSIRARPASLFVSLHLPSAQLRNAIPPEVGFQLATTELDRNGHISLMRLLPSAKPFQAAQTRNTFQIGSVAVVPADARQRVQLTPTGSAPMTVELIAHLEVAGVKLSPTFQVGQLILKWPTAAVRVTLNPKAPEATAARFQVTAAKLADSGQIAELLLDPVK